MECSNDDNFKRLVNISKVLFPLLLLVSFVGWQLYRHSYDVIEIKVVTKNVTWIDACTDASCVETPVFNVWSEDELFTTTESNYESIEVGRQYIISVRGWQLFNGKRKLIKVYL